MEREAPLQRPQPRSLVQVKTQGQVAGHRWGALCPQAPGIILGQLWAQSPHWPWETHLTARGGPITRRQEMGLVQGATTHGHLAGETP